MSVQEVNNEYVILTENLCKDYTYYKKEAGLKGSLKNLFHREKLTKKAVQNLSINSQRSYCWTCWFEWSWKDYNFKNVDRYYNANKW